MLFIDARHMHLKAIVAIAHVILPTALVDLSVVNEVKRLQERISAGQYVVVTEQEETRSECRLTNF